LGYNFPFLIDVFLSEEKIEFVKSLRVKPIYTVVGSIDLKDNNVILMMTI
jgi:hypothetical protein